MSHVWSCSTKVIMKPKKYEIVRISYFMKHNLAGIGIDSVPNESLNQTNWPDRDWRFTLGINVPLSIELEINQTFDDRYETLLSSCIEHSIVANYSKFSPPNEHSNWLAHYWNFLIDVDLVSSVSPYQRMHCALLYISKQLYHSPNKPETNRRELKPERKKKWNTFAQLWTKKNKPIE